MKFNNLFEQDFKIVENKKKVFIAPLVVIALALVMCIIFGFVFGSPFNLGMDFTGGYTMSIRLGNALTEDNKKEYEDLAKSIAESIESKDGKKIVISTVQPQGEGGTAGFRLMYKAIADEEEMTEINARLKDALESSMFFDRPKTVEFNEARTEANVAYSLTKLVGDYDYQLKTRLVEAGFNVGTATVSEDCSSIKFTFASAVPEDALDKIVEALTISKDYDGEVSDGGQTTSTVSSVILKSALLAVSIALLCMLVYIVIRFELLSGIAAVVALFHDILMMVCFMGIFYVPINSTFIAALITILGYSINNTIIIFDRVRENVKLYSSKRIDGKMVKPAYIANKSVQETIWRSINTTITTLIMIAMVAIIGVSDIQVFALPIIFGLIAGTYSSIFLAPTIWAMLAKAFPGTIKVKDGKKSKAKREKAKAEK